MVGGDEPQLQVQVVVPLLHADEVQDVVVLHAAHAVDLVLVLPRQLVLGPGKQRRGSQEFLTISAEFEHLMNNFPINLFTYFIKSVCLPPPDMVLIR